MARAHKITADALASRDATIAALKRELEAAAHNLETGDSFYKCPGLNAAAKRARAFLTRQETPDDQETDRVG